MGRDRTHSAAVAQRTPGCACVSRAVCLLRIFSRIQKSLRSRWGLGPCNQSIASGFGAAEIKSVFQRF